MRVHTKLGKTFYSRKPENKLVLCMYIMLSERFGNWVVVVFFLNILILFSVHLVHFYKWIINWG